jgi:butyrate kinase
MSMEKSHWIVVINPGSTSTKIALYENNVERYRKSLDYSTEEINKYKTIYEQYPFRRDSILDYLKEINFDIKQLSAVAGRGGALPALKSGAYIVNDLMIERLKKLTSVHASTLGAMLALEIARPLGIPAYIYDAVSVDELQDVARLSGVPEIPRIVRAHVLNMRAVAFKCAEKLGRPYKDLNLIVAHLGGGITMSVHSNGRMIDVVKDDEGPFSPERSGSVPCIELVDCCYSGKWDYLTAARKIKGQGGLVAYLGTNDVRKVEEMIRNGDEYAKLVFSTMAYQIAKSIGSLMPVVKGKADRIILTGGVAHSKMLTEQIADMVDFIAPVEIYPGENELESLALGTLRVITGREQPHEYDKETDSKADGDIKY